MDAAILVPSALGSALTGASIGLVSHWAYFVHGEHHRTPVKLALMAFASPLIVYAGQHLFLKTDFFTLAKSSIIILTAFWTALWSSIIVYRLAFHRLRSFPGPLLSRVTKLEHLFATTKKNNFKYLQELHDAYGPFVRTGPNEITILHPDGPEALYGARSKCEKSPWYDIGYPMVSVQTCRDRATHDKRRRVWDQGFSVRALRDFEDRELKITRRLIDQIGAHAGQTMNASHWFNFYSFDVMGELAFGQSFGMVEKGEVHEAMDMLHKAMAPYAFLGTVPWFMNLLIAIPGAGKEFNTFAEWCAMLADKRSKIKTEHPDVMTYLIEDKNQYSIQNDWLKGDARLIVVAGSDTTAASLVHIFYYLAANPEEIQKLRAELRPLVPDLDAFRASDVADAGHLNGCINEALRLNPPVPSGLFRLTPPEGLTIGDTFIPGGVTVSVPSQPIGRMESCYEKANEFVPERWYSKPDMIRNKKVFTPFSLGRYGCVGKQLAYMEMRSVIALTILQFDVKLAPGETGVDLLQNTVDTFTVSLGKLELVFDKI